MAKKQTAAPSEAEQILEKAKERGLESNYFFTTTFKRYQGQIKLVETLQRVVDSWNEAGGFDPKTIRLYNAAISGANGTAATLVAIIKKLGTEEPQESKFQAFLDRFKDDEN